jgi:hypothetical protein
LLKAIADGRHANNDPIAKGKTVIRNSLARSVFTGLLIAAPLFVTSIASAQTPAPGTRIPVDNKQVISANPFLMMAEYYNVEFERKHTETRTFGLSASGVGVGDANYRNFQAFYRYYPQGASLTGFYIGARGGVHRVSEDGDAGTAFGLGIELGYGWLFGRERNFAVSIGGGATRLFGGDLHGASPLIPTLRLVNLGWSF